MCLRSAYTTRLSMLQNYLQKYDVENSIIVNFFCFFLFLRTALRSRQAIPLSWRNATKQRCVLFQLLSLRPFTRKKSGKCPNAAMQIRQNWSKQQSTEQFFNVLGRKLILGDRIKKKQPRRLPFRYHQRAHSYTERQWTFPFLNIATVDFCGT